jgi:hypothetical protein
MSGSLRIAGLRHPGEAHLHVDPFASVQHVNVLARRNFFRPFRSTPMPAVARDKFFDQVRVSVMKMCTDVFAMLF